MKRVHVAESRPLCITLVSMGLLVAYPVILSLTATATATAATPASQLKAKAHPRTSPRHISPSSLVLTSVDVPAGYLRISATHFTLAELAQQGTWSVGQLIAWGYVGGFESQFTRAPDTADQAQLSSNAGVYRTARGAALSLAANADNCSRLEGWRELIPRPTLGDEAHLCQVSTVVRGATAITYFVVWRIGRFKGSVSLTGLVGVFVPADALALARLQAVKMRRVIDGRT